MGGFTQIKLKNCSKDNILRQNTIMNIYNVPKQYRFYCLENEQIIEYEYYKRNMGSFPEHSFPRKEIQSLADFRKFWTPSALGEVFVPYSGYLQFDCYFGRTSKRAMRKIGKYIVENIEEFDFASGSFSTFMERGMTSKQRQIVEDYGLRY